MKLNPAYLEWLRGLPCWACEQTTGGRSSSRVESAHVGLSTSRRGLSQKYPDIESIPLCGLEHHREGKFSIHRMGPAEFFKHFHADRDEVIRMFQNIWRPE